MNWYLLSKFIINFAIVPITIYLSYTGLVNYKKTRTKYMLYYISAFALLAFGNFIYSLTPLLIEGQDFLAEIVLGGSFIVMMLALPVYIEYFHGIYRKIPYISKLFYFAVGSGITLLFFQPWEVSYTNDFLGYDQSVSDLMIISIFIQITCIFIIMIQTFRVIKTRIDHEFVNVEQALRESTSSQELIIRMEDRKDNLRGKKRILNYIMLSYFLGICILVFGLLLPVGYLDSIGILLGVAPHAYFFSRDKEMQTYLSAQNLLDETKNLQKKLHKLHQQSTIFPQIIKAEIQSMVDFIEKADLILPHRNK